MPIQYLKANDSRPPLAHVSNHLSRQPRVLPVMVNTHIIHPCTSLKKLSYGKSLKLPEEVHHVIMVPIPFGA
jgi:hypothetical protein